MSEMEKKAEQVGIDYGTALLFGVLFGGVLQNILHIDAGFSIGLGLGLLVWAVSLKRHNQKHANAVLLITLVGLVTVLLIAIFL